jgi:hypothetical protein
MAKSNDIEAIVMRLLRERLGIYKTAGGEDVISNEVMRALRNEIVELIATAISPERVKTGAFVFTHEASLAESEQRKTGDRSKNESAKPKSV